MMWFRVSFRGYRLRLGTFHAGKVLTAFRGGQDVCIFYIVYVISKMGGIHGRNV